MFSIFSESTTTHGPNILGSGDVAYDRSAKKLMNASIHRTAKARESLTGNDIFIISTPSFYNRFQGKLYPARSEGTE
jgi:hypothetical protein